MLKSSLPVPAQPAALAPLNIKDKQPGQSTAYSASTQQKSHSETLWIKTSSDPVALYTAVLAVATIGLWIFTALLWLVTRRAISDTAGTSLRQLRAYVTVHGDFRVISKPNEPFRVEVVFKNTGLTPARFCETRVMVFIKDFGVVIHRSELNKIVMEFPPDEFKSKDTIATNETQHNQTGLDALITTTQVAQGVKSGKWAVIIAGYAKYQDFSGEPRETTFRGYIHRDNKNGGQGFVVAPFGNDIK